MMKLFKTLGRKKAPPQPPQNAPEKPPENLSYGGEMAAHLSADLLMPETRNMIRAIADQISFGHKPQASSAEDRDHPAAEIAPLSRNPVDEDPTAAPPSEGMQKLLNELSRKLFPHRHSKDENAKNPALLLEKLREDLSKLEPTPLEKIAPTAASENLDPTAAAILARSGMPADISAGMEDSISDPSSSEDSATSPKSVGGDTKPEHATKEALGNPFSLVNINRGATSAVAITPSVQHQDIEEDTSKKKSRRKQVVERSTVNYRKKLQQSRFSRRRYLREYRGTTILGAIFSFFLLVGFTVGTVVTNVSVIIPQTRINQDAGKQSEAFRNEIDRNQPKLTGLLQRRQSLEQKLQSLTDNFVSSNQIRDDYTRFLNKLDEDPRVEVSEQTIEAVENELPNIQAINVSFRVTTSFLLWLKYRNQMVREYDDINVIEETITAPPGIATVNVFIRLSRPGRSD